MSTSLNIAIFKHLFHIRKAQIKYNSSSRPPWLTTSLQSKLNQHSPSPSSLYIRHYSLICPTTATSTPSKSMQTILIYAIVKILHQIQMHIQSSTVPTMIEIGWFIGRRYFNTTPGFCTTVHVMLIPSTKVNVPFQFVFIESQLLRFHSITQRKGDII